MRNLIFYKNLKTKNISIVLIFAKYKNKWLLCKHKKRDTYEICGGHIENGESIYNAAKRELYEESGALVKDIKLMGYLSKVINTDKPRQYAAVFIADIDKIENLPNYEMKEIALMDEFPENTTYPETYNKLLKLIRS